MMPGTVPPWSIAGILGTVYFMGLNSQLRTTNTQVFEKGFLLIVKITEDE